MTTPLLETTLVLMGRRPHAGITKTRLIPALGAVGAQTLARAMLEDLAERLAGVGAGRVVLALTGPPLADGDALALPEGLVEVEQGEGDLGERMAEIHDAFAPRVVFVGADCPTVPPSVLVSAAEWLGRGYDAVFQPARDGGYTVGAFATDPRPLFTGIHWGGPDVLAHTLDRAEIRGMRVALLEPGYDIDGGEDLAILRYHLPVLAGTAAWPRRTAALLETLTSPERT